MKVRRLNSCLVCALVLTALALPSHAQSIFELDPARSSVHFTLKTSLHTVHGTFKLKNSKINLDPATGQALGVIVADAVSGDTGNTGRDTKMHKEIIESWMYPEITFTPRKIEGHLEGAGISRIEAKGTFRLLGRDQDFDVPVVVHIMGSDLTLDADFSVPYLAWGLKNPGTFILRASDTVQVMVHAAGRWTPSVTN